VALRDGRLFGYELGGLDAAPPADTKAKLEARAVLVVSGTCTGDDDDDAADEPVAAKIKERN
jgi:hypothetical protein